MVNYPATLIVDADSAAATQLAEQLRHAGFVTDIATSCWAADAAILARFYGSLVCIADPNRPSDLECVCTLRRRSPRTWIVLVTSGARMDTRGVRADCGADAFLTTPFSMQDLLHRLAAFSQRPRPLDAC